MKCEYFGACGSCTLYEKNYEEQLNFKIEREKERFSNFTNCDFEIIRSKEENFRNRAEFRIWKNFDENDNPTISYAMTSFEKKSIEIDSCQIVTKHIQEIMDKLLNILQEDEVLRFKLYAVEFLNSTTNDMLVTLIYHKKLDDVWTEKAKEIEQNLDIKIIGRSRGQKVIVSEEFINETLNINNKDFKFLYQEGGFTQPNSEVKIFVIYI